MSRSYAKRTRYMSAPVAVSSSVEQQTGQKAVSLRGREFITDVVAYSPAGANPTSSNYKVNSTRISPTDSNLFSWLTAIAEKFETYKFHGLAFTFEPQCTTNTTGCVGVYFDPDPTNTALQTWSTFTNTGCNTHGACWAKHQLLVPSRFYADRKQYYVPDQYADAGSTVQNIIDPLEYYIGNVGVCTVGVVASPDTYTVIGKLYLDYAITLAKATIDTVPRTAIKGLNNAAVAPTGKLVSPYFAMNSGGGMIVRPTNTTAGVIFGVSAAGAGGTINAGTLPVRYGDELWSWAVSTAGSVTVDALSNVIALQTEDLLFSIYLKGLSGGQLAFHFENSNGDVSTLSTFSDIAQGFIAGTIPAPGMTCIGSIHVQAGERISCVVTGAAGTMDPANSFMIFTPYTWGLEK